MKGVSKLVDGDRLWGQLMSLAAHGALPGGGVNRQALSQEEAMARASIMRWARAIGLQPATDAAANLFLRLPGREENLPAVFVGSHIDSQPTGGKFDGAFDSWLRSKQSKRLSRLKNVRGAASMLSPG